MDVDDPQVKRLRFAKVLVWLVYAYFVLTMIILVVAFFLLLFNASTAAEFTQWVYRSATGCSSRSAGSSRAPPWGATAR